jgi:hypothetical protein
MPDLRDKVNTLAYFFIGQTRNPGFNALKHWSPVTSIDKEPFPA